jgi:lipopolysaccharide export system permease protein
MKASGISLYRITLPLFLVTALLALFHFQYNEYIYPSANKRRLEIKNFTIERKSREALTKINNVYRQIRPGTFYTISDFNTNLGLGHNFRLYKSDNNQLAQIITAKKIVYRDFLWQAQDSVIVRNFVDTLGNPFEEFDTLTIMSIKDRPDDFARSLGKPEDMSLDELKNYINLMKRTGGPHIREQIDLKIKYAYPLTSVIVVLISVPFASNPQRRGIAVSFAAGAMIALIYFVLFQMMKSAGYNEKIPQEIAVWGVNGLFFLVGIALMLRARK